MNNNNDNSLQNSEADKYIASFLFPGENVNYTPSVVNLRETRQHLDDALGTSLPEQNGQFKCSSCCKNFQKKSNLDRHVKKNCCNKSFKCRIGCENHFMNKVFRDRHETSCQASGTEFKCHSCGKYFQKKFNLDRHVKKNCCNKSFKCRFGCAKHFMNKEFRDRHETSCQASGTKFKCPICGENFQQKNNLDRHVKNNACASTCEVCNKKLTSHVRLRRHLETHSFKCPVCKISFRDRQLFFDHCRGHLNSDFLNIQQVKKLRGILKMDKTVRHYGTTVPSTSAVGPSATASTSFTPSSPSNNRPNFKQTERFIMGQAAVIYTFRPDGLEKNSLLDSFTGRRRQIEQNLENRRMRWTNIRWYLTVTARMQKYDSAGNLRDEDTPSFRSKSRVLMTGDEIGDQVDEAYFNINKALENFCTDTSGWILDEILSFDQSILKYIPLGGACADFVLPETLENKDCLISVVGRPYDSTDCFYWGFISSIHGKNLVENQRHPSLHWTQLADYRKKYTLTSSMKSANLVSIDMIPEFEDINKVSVNVFGFDLENEIVFPIRVSNRQRDNVPHANLLLLSEVKKPTNNYDNADTICMHYIGITDLGALVSPQVNDSVPYKHKLFACPRCLTTKYSKRDLEKHLDLCSLTDPVNVQMPSKGSNFIRFRNYHKQLFVPFIIVVRFECFRMPIMDLDEPTVGSTVRERKFSICGFSYFRISVNDSNPSSPVTFVSNDQEEVMNEFLIAMEKEQKEILSILSVIQPMVYCDQGFQNIQASNNACHICGDPFLPGDRVVLDHCHVSSVIRGRAHSSCNLSFRIPTFIPVVVENMSSVEGRLLLSAKALYDNKMKITVVAKAIDTYASVTIDKCRYIDFNSFFKAPLDKLIQGLKLEEGTDAFPYTRRHWPSGPTNVELIRVPLCRDYLHGPENMLETNLPKIEAFGDKMAPEDPSKEDYARALRVWNNELKEKTLREYLKFTITTDCLFMADLVTAFRKEVHSNGELKLDPMQYLTMASFAWDSALRFSQAVLELPTDIEMHLMIESALRGGLAVTGTPRYARANDPRLPDFDPSQPQSSLLFTDFNGLYCFTMAESRLPTYGFKFLSLWELERFDFEEIPEDSDHGYILEVDISYPETLHDKHNDFPLAPEHVFIKKEDLSLYTRETAEACGINLDNLSQERRLCQTFKDKTKYTVHYRTLQFYAKKGLVVTKVHRVLKFCQTQFLKTFMEYCAERRRHSKSDLYSSLYKNIANTVAGKTGQNVRSFIDVRICSNDKQLQKLASKPTFHSMRVFDNNLVAVQLYRSKVVLNSPISVNFTILELSKLHVFSFLYDFVKPVLAKDGQVNFLSGDTDSMIVKISNVPDLTERLRKHSQMFDFSNLPTDHELYDITNKKVPGKVKFELAGHVCEEFVALSPKCYSMKSERGFKQARKGSSKEIKHDIYKQCLLTSSCHRENVNEIRHYGQRLYSVSANKRLLSVLDLKRFHINSTDSLAFDHYMLKNNMGNSTENK